MDGSIRMKGEESDEDYQEQQDEGKIAEGERDRGN